MNERPVFGDPTWIALNQPLSRNDHSEWRNQARPIIRQIILDNASNVCLAELRKLISAAYPFGLRKNHPYQMWLKEVKFQLSLLPSSTPSK